MSNFKKWFHGTWISILSAVGIQYARPPVYEHPPVVITTSPSPAQTPSIKLVIPTPTLPLSHPQVEEGKFNGNDDELPMFKKAVVLDNAVLASDCYKNFILKAKFTETNGMSDAEIYNFLSKEVKKVNVEMFDGTWKQNYIWKTMGIDVGDGVVYANRFYINTPELLGSLNLHEIAHQYNFRHDGAFSTSVPYGQNDAFYECNK